MAVIFILTKKRLIVEYTTQLTILHMVKNTVFQILSIIFYSLIPLKSLCYSDELPLAASTLQDQRNAAVRKINEKYIEALMKVKVDLTKAGDLQGALAVEGKINAVKASLGLNNSNATASKVDVSESSLAGRWEYTCVNNGYKESWVFLENGKMEAYVRSTKHDGGTWSIKNDQLVVVKTDNDSKSGITYKFPLDALVCWQIDGTKGSAMIKKESK